MKVIVLLVISFLTSVAFAAPTEIQCVERGSETQRLQISVSEVDSKIEGISLFNPSLGQTAQSTFKKSVGQYTYYSYFISISLEDGTEILIPSVVLNGKTKAIVHTGDGREYNCN